MYTVIYYVEVIDIDDILSVLSFSKNTFDDCNVNIFDNHREIYQTDQTFENTNLLLSICNSNPLLRKHEKHILKNLPHFAMFGVSQNKKCRIKAHLIHGQTVAVMCDESLFPVVRLQTLLASLGTRNTSKETSQRSRPNNSALHH